VRTSYGDPQQSRKLILNYFSTLKHILPRIVTLQPQRGGRLVLLSLLIV
jgi:hypothetical protein